MMLISYYIILLVSTYFIFRNAKKAWKELNDFTLPIATIILFYFTIIGAFVFPIDAYFDFAGTNIGFYYTAIFDRLFRVTFNWSYFLSVMYYIVFILVLQYFYLYLIRRKIKKNQEGKILIEQPRTETQQTINPYLVFLVTCLLIFMSAFLLRHEILSAIVDQSSIYVSTRQNSNRFYTLHQLANEFAVFLPYMVFGIWLIRSERIVLKKVKMGVFIVVLACVLSALYIAILGNRREILSGLIFCIMLAVPFWKKIDKKKLLYLFCFSFLLFALNTKFRSNKIPIFLNKIFVHSSAVPEETKEKESHSPLWIRLRNFAAPLVFSNELFYAHFSMYGAIKKEVPLTYGSSFVHLAKSVVPRSLAPNLPPSIYEYYAKEVDSQPGQNYTIHHATAWYLNFGFIGVIIGALLLSFILYVSYVGYHFPKVRKSNFWSTFYFLLPFLVSAHLVTFVTTGPEAYKSMILEGMLIPVALLTVCMFDLKWLKTRFHTIGQKEKV